MYHVKEMEFKYTKKQVAHRTLPDDEHGYRYYLIKACHKLCLIYQIKLALYTVVSKKINLILAIPKDCVISKKLKEFSKENKKYMKIERF